MLRSAMRHLHITTVRGHVTLVTTMYLEPVPMQSPPFAVQQCILVGGLLRTTMYSESPT